jgi:hypothetical protein
MSKLVNRAKMTTATTGTGTITLGAAVPGYQTFAAAGVADGDVVRYVIEDNNDWEIGTGTYTASGTTLSRTVTESSNSGNALNLSGAARVFVSATAADVQTSVKITGGTIDGASVGSTTPAAGAFTTLALGGTAVTATAAELNILDGVTATAAQINRAAELSARNAIINGNFGINQRGVSGTVTLAAGAYGHDRWKAGASGCTYTFATSGNVTTLTISAGSLIQVIEGINLFDGTYVLSWTGTAQGKIGAGSFGNSGITGSVTGGTNLNIEFGTGTVSLVQFEQGTIATPFEHRSFGQELALCQRYFESGGALTFIVVSNVTGVFPARGFAVTKRADPTMTISPNAGTGADITALAQGFYQSVSNSVDSGAAWTASAEL